MLLRMRALSLRSTGALRKSREDSKDEPGGADFYFGEMEMRRIAARRFLFNAYSLLHTGSYRAMR
jgi:hypothetical protein